MSDQMSSKERLLAAIKGEETDRLPWSPFLAYWWESNPDLWEIGQYKYLKSLRCDPLLRGSSWLFGVSQKNVSYTSKSEGNITYTTTETPVGNLRSANTYVKEANTSFLTEHPVKTKEDMKILTYIIENTVITPNFTSFDDLAKEVGDGGLAVPLMISQGKGSFQLMIEHYVGTEELNYMLADYPEEVENCLAVMWENSRKCADIAVQSDAEAFIFWEDSSTSNVSPAQFKKYVMEEINYWGRKVHENGKYLLHHACGSLKGFMPIFKDMEIDMIESISPPPTGDIELWDAYDILKKSEKSNPVGLIGGIEPVMLLTLPEEDLRVYTMKLIDNMKSRDCKRFILANSDSCPVGVDENKFKLVTELVDSLR
jgi:uroporphyrinogen-III decarboxylase